MKIRLAKISDAFSLLKIYSQYIDTTITFEYTLPTVSEFENRIENIIKDYMKKNPDLPAYLGMGWDDGIF